VLPTIFAVLWQVKLSMQGSGLLCFQRATSRHTLHHAIPRNANQTLPHAHAGAEGELLAGSPIEAPVSGREMNAYLLRHATVLLR
jgi:hypothetical protein